MGKRWKEKEWGKENENVWAGPGLNFDPKPDSEYREVILKDLEQFLNGI